MSQAETGSPDMVKPVRTWSRLSGDAMALIALAAVTALVVGNRLTVDPWLSRVDVLVFYLPMYDFLGDRLRALDMPGWNPYLFSGAPFAADAQSGWMYLPAMLFFPFLGAISAFKAMVAFQVAIAAFATYGFARLLGMQALAALVAAIVYAFGPFLQWNTYCCTVMAQLAVWFPVALLGIELSLRADRWLGRAATWVLIGFAVSQMASGWLGKGTIYAGPLIASYFVYRALTASRTDGAGPVQRLKDGAIAGAASAAFGVALSAAGLLPRLALNAETNLAGGRYDRLGPAGHDWPPLTFESMLRYVLGDGYDQRRAAIGGAALVLSLMAPLIAWRRFAVSYFSVLVFVTLVLSLDTTSLHRLFYLIPRVRVLHEHDPWQVMVLLPIGVAVLSGATLQSIDAGRHLRSLLPLAAVPLLVVGAAVGLLARRGSDVDWAPVIAAGLTTAAVGMAFLARGSGAWGYRRRASTAAQSVIFLTALLQPTGLELVESWLSRPFHRSWEPFWTPDAARDRSIEANASRTDPGGAGGFLQGVAAESEPFRYVGYGGIGFGDDAFSRVPYFERRLDPGVQAILVNARPIRLGLHEIQGYNPMQLQRYVEFIAAVNGEPQNYHVSYLRAGGVASPLLDLLNVRFIAVDTRLPVNRSDVAALTRGLPVVFRNPQVVVYENAEALPRAWIVHDVRLVERGEALRILTSGTIDPRTTAVVEGSLPEVGQPADPAGEAARVTRYEADRIELSVSAGAPGLVVVSEIFASGWLAYVDGKRVDILPTDHVLRGIPVSAGEHRVVLEYSPRSLRVGLLISGIAIAIGMAVILAFVAQWLCQKNGRAGRGAGASRSRARSDPPRSAAESRLPYPENA